MKLFTTDTGDVTDAELATALDGLALRGRCVLVYSRLLRFGRLTAPDAVARIIAVLQDQVGTRGTLCIPCYTYSGYRGEIFDPDTTPGIVGVLGEVARRTPGFVRLPHPIYSTACWGARAAALQLQDPHTCFGPASFFARFDALPEATILLLGTTLSAITLTHYYDQRYAIPGRLAKSFDAQWRRGGHVQPIRFDSWVRDHATFPGQEHCPARLDAAATALGLIARQRIAGDWLHTIPTATLHRLWRAAATLDPQFYLFGTPKEFEQYYERNMCTLAVAQVTPQHCNTLRAELHRNDSIVASPATTML